MSGLTNLRGVEIGNKSGFEYIKKLLKDKRNEVNEKEPSVRNAAKEGLILVELNQEIAALKIEDYTNIESEIAELKKKSEERKARL